MKVNLQIMNGEQGLIAEGVEGTPVPEVGEILAYKTKDGVTPKLKVKERAFLYTEHPDQIGQENELTVVLACEAVE